MSYRSAPINPSQSPVTVSGADAAATAGRASNQGAWGDIFGRIVGGIGALADSVADTAGSVGNAVATVRSARDNARGVSDANGRGATPQKVATPITMTHIAIGAGALLLVYLVARK